MPVCAASTSRNLNPYHEQQLESQIRKCASGVLACSDAEQRSLKQQELCQLLIRAERYDEAMQVAYNIYKSEPSATERRAAYHFMVAEIHSRKMKAASSPEEMETCRRDALAAAQDVLNQKYPSKWHVSEYARDLVRDLSDSTAMARVRQRVVSRQGKGDVTKEAIADAQRKYLDATQGRAGARSVPPADQPRFVRAQPQQRIEQTASVQAPAQEQERPRSLSMEGSRERESNPAVSRNQVASMADPIQAPGNSLPGEPRVTRVVSPMQRLTAGETQAMDRLGAAGLLTSQPGLADAAQPTVQTQRQPILVNGQPAQSNQATVDSIVQNNLAQLLEDARKRKAAEHKNSPYATGQIPQSKMR
jgi:hypothetical protein